MRMADCHPGIRYYCKGLCYKCYRKHWLSTPKGKAATKRASDKWRQKAISEGRGAIRYGMQISRRVWNQDRCQICGDPEPKQQGKKFFVDHDHSVIPAVARGILCHHCNISLGFVEGWMRRNLLDVAIQYVRTHGFEKDMAA